MNQTEQKRKEQRRDDVDKVLISPKRPFLSTRFSQLLGVIGIVNIAGALPEERTKRKRQERQEREREREREIKNKRRHTNKTTQERSKKTKDRNKK